MWPTVPKMVIIWSFREKVCWPLSHITLMAVPFWVSYHTSTLIGVLFLECQGTFPGALSWLFSYLKVYPNVHKIHSLKSSCWNVTFTVRPTLTLFKIIIPYTSHPPYHAFFFPSFPLQCKLQESWDFVLFIAICPESRTVPCTVAMKLTFLEWMFIRQLDKHV